MSVCWFDSIRFWNSQLFTNICFICPTTNGLNTKREKTTLKNSQMNKTLVFDWHISFILFIRIFWKFYPSIIPRIYLAMKVWRLGEGWAEGYVRGKQMKYKESDDIEPSFGKRVFHGPSCIQIEIWRSYLRENGNLMILYYWERKWDFGERILWHF